MRDVTPPPPFQSPPSVSHSCEVTEYFVDLPCLWFTRSTPPPPPPSLETGLECLTTLRSVSGVIVEEVVSSGEVKRSRGHANSLSHDLRDDVTQRPVIKTRRFCEAGVQHTAEASESKPDIVDASRKADPSSIGVLTVFAHESGLDWWNTFFTVAAAPVYRNTNVNALADNFACIGGSLQWN